jgi:ADP-heptose:LPS heptosyltransferase
LLNKDKHKIPFRLKVHRAKNTPYFRFFDNIISKIKPPKKFKGIPKKILLIRNDKIGDAMVTLPVMRTIKYNYPDIKIDVLVSDRNEFLFKSFSYVDELIKFSPEGWDTDKIQNKIYKFFFIGHILQFIRFFLIPYFFNKKFKQDIKNLKVRNYDAVVDLVGSRRNIILSRMISKFTVGSKVFGLFWLYSYYIKTNWVTTINEDFMSRKVGNALSEALNFDLRQKNKSLPLLNFEFRKETNIKTDIIIHLGGSVYRKFPYEKEKELINSLSNYRLIITDAGNTEGFRRLKEEFKNFPNIKFKLYNYITDMLEDVAVAKLFLCYDGGQAHFISQYIKTIVIFGSGSLSLWKPYEFEDYGKLASSTQGAIAYKSKGQFGHIAIHYPIWCNPCFDIGCETRPCLGNISIEFVKLIINNNIDKTLKSDA